MRKPKRIKPFMKELGDIWEKNFPDWRFGQFMSNAFGWIQSKHGDIFFPEEDKMLQYFHEYVESIKHPKPEPLHLSVKGKLEFSIEAELVGEWIHDVFGGYLARSSDLGEFYEKCQDNLQLVTLTDSALSFKDLDNKSQADLSALIIRYYLDHKL